MYHATNRKGFTLVEIMIVVCLFGVLLMMAIPYFLTYRDAAQETLVTNHLQMIDSAKDLWAINSGLSNGAEPSKIEIAVFIKGGKLPAPPDADKGGVYVINPVGIIPEYVPGT